MQAIFSHSLSKISLQCKSFRPKRQLAAAFSASARSSRDNNPARKFRNAEGGGVKRHDRGGMPKLTIAIEGCCHGELDKIYSTLQLLEQREGKKIDLLICCGDFQAVRNLDDLETLACPPKYRSMQTFYKYYSGERVAPFPTLFIGGNHEAAAHLWELYYGGWAAPNIYFLGFAGAVRFGGLRIAGLSGIYKSHDYTRGHHEALPYTESTMRSIYHVRDFEVYRLLQLLQPTDIFLTHDWPVNIARYGNLQQLLARKTYLRSEVESGTLGSPPAAHLLSQLRPAYWFSAHMHVKFAALVKHGPQPPPAQKQQQAGAGAGAVAGAAAGDGGGVTGGSGFPETRFLALDKCLPGRDFLQVIELDAPGPPELHYDEEWLAVLRSTQHLTNLRFQHAPLPGMGSLRTGPRPEDLEFVRRALAARGSSRIPNNFQRTAEPHDPRQGARKGRMPARHMRNPQTVELLELLGVPYNLDHKDVRGQGAGGGGGGGGTRPGARGVMGGWPPAPAVAAAGGGAEDNGQGGAGARPGNRAPLSLAPHSAPPRPRGADGATAGAAPVLAPNPEEIDLGDLDADEDEEDGGEQAQRKQGNGADALVGAAAPAGAGAGGGAGAGAGGPLEEDPMFQPMSL